MQSAFFLLLKEISIAAIMSTTESSHMSFLIHERELDDLRIPVFSIPFRGR